MSRAAHEAALAEVAAAAEKAVQGGGEKARERHLSRGKMLPRDRVAGLLDPGSPFLEIGATAAHGMYDGAAPCAGVVAGIGICEVPPLKDVVGGPGDVDVVVAPLKSERRGTVGCGHESRGAVDVPI